MTHRLTILLIWFFMVWSVLVARGLQIQLFPSNNLKQASLKQYQRVVKLNSKRGDIFDRNGAELAISIPAHSLFADPALIKKPRNLATKLTRVLPLSYKTIYKKITKKHSRFVWIQRLLDENTRKKIEALNEVGLGFKEEFKRIYPNRNLLAHTIGFVGADGRGLEGLESRYDATLNADEIMMNLPKDGRKRFLVEDGWLFMQNNDGDDIYLTIDADLQYYVEQELKKAISYHQAEGAWAVVLNPKTSEILALASMPDYDLNAAANANKEMRRNRALTDVYEPGSTLKTMFLVGALKNKIVQPNTVFDVSSGQVEIDGRIIRESDTSHIFRSLTTTEILAKSSNVGVSKIAMKMKDQQIYDIYREFGLGERIAQDLAGESKGIFNAPPWRAHLKANISFGHGIAVNALQVANAYAAIANGGTLNRPYVVKQKKSMTGMVRMNTSPGLRQVMTPKEAERIKMMLVAATGDEGTGKAARVKGFVVAGKTGTAQKVDPAGRGYLKGQYISSFAGFLPAHDPEFVIYVAFDNPREHGFYGADTAAPVFSRIAQYAINKRGLAPVLFAAEDLIKDDLAVKPLPAAEESGEVIPNMQGWATREVIRYFQEKDMDVKLVGAKGRVVRTAPNIGEPWPADKKIKVYFE